MTWTFCLTWYDVVSRHDPNEELSIWVYKKSVLARTLLDHRVGIEGYGNDQGSGQ